MKSEKPPSDSKRSPRFLLLMPDDVRDGVTRAAAVHGRTVTAEINLRLRDSLSNEGADGVAPSPGAYAVRHSPTVATTGEGGQPLSDIERAMLVGLKRLSAEKQLALLTFLK